MMGAANQVVIQSFLERKYTVHFRYTKDTTDQAGNPVKSGDPIKVGGVYKTLTIPSIYTAPNGKNIVIVTKEDFDAIRQDLATYLEMGQHRKGVVVLDDIPQGYWDPAQQVADARAKKAAAEAERDGALMKVLELEEEVSRLKKLLTETYGWKE